MAERNGNCILGDPVPFSSLPGWETDAHQEALRTFAFSALKMLDRAPRTRALGLSGDALSDVARWYNMQDEGLLDDEAHAFFETYFAPRPIFSDGCENKNRRGFVTGYYEPEVEGARERGGPYQYPLLGHPHDLVSLSSLTPDIAVPEDWDKENLFGRIADGRFEEFPDRQAIETGALQDQNLELVFLKSPIDAFFIHIQGSARIRLNTGEVMRVGYAGKSGQRYTPIGRILIERGEVAREEMSMQAIRDWLEAHPNEQNELMWHNRSFIFFRKVDDLDPERGPVGAGNVQLTPGRSLAVDRHLHTFGAPVFLNADFDKSFQRLMIAQDTGSAIVGPARGDIFFGAGSKAEEIAGTIQHPADFFLLWPKHQPI